MVGYTNADGGLAGMESKYDAQLKGTDGRLEVERGSNGLQIPGGVRQETDAVPGSTVQLTLDQDLQYQLQQGLAAAEAKAKARSGQAVILDAHTGEVLAMANAPTYDSQAPGKAPKVAGTNPAVQAPVEPGSANKVVTFSAAVEHGKLRPDTPLLVPDSIKVADRYVHDAWSHAPANWTATGVLAKSSNVGTLMIAKNLVGPAQFYDTERKFGIGTKTGIELPGESGGILPAPDTWSGSTFGNLPIGQGLSMTPLQLAGMYQTIANDGVRVQPRIVRSVIGPDGTSTPTAAARRTTAVISPTAARTVRSMLEAVVAKGGTAPKAAIDNYRVAGKTGTAQRPNPACKCYSGGGYWATFAGIAPADKPELVMSVVITEPPGGGEGGSVAAPLFHDVMSYALTARKVPPTGTRRADSEADRRLIRVPGPAPNGPAPPRRQGTWLRVCPRVRDHAAAAQPAPAAPVDRAGGALGLPVPVGDAVVTGVTHDIGRYAPATSMRRCPGSRRHGAEFVRPRRPRPGRSPSHRSGRAPRRRPRPACPSWSCQRPPGGARRGRRRRLRRTRPPGPAGDRDHRHRRQDLDRVPGGVGTAGRRALTGLIGTVETRSLGESGAGQRPHHPGGHRPAGLLAAARRSAGSPRWRWRCPATRWPWAGSAASGSPSAAFTNLSARTTWTSTPTWTTTSRPRRGSSTAAAARGGQPRRSGRAPAAQAGHASPTPRPATRRDLAGGDCGPARPAATAFTARGGIGASSAGLVRCRAAQRGQRAAGDGRAGRGRGRARVAAGRVAACAGVPGRLERVDAPGRCRGGGRLRAHAGRGAAALAALRPGVTAAG